MTSRYYNDSYRQEENERFWKIEHMYHPDRNFLLVRLTFTE